MKRISKSCKKLIGKLLHRNSQHLQNVTQHYKQKKNHKLAERGTSDSHKVLFFCLALYKGNKWNFFLRFQLKIRKMIHSNLAFFFRVNLCSNFSLVTGILGQKNCSLIFLCQSWSFVSPPPNLQSSNKKKTQVRPDYD